MWTTPLPSPFRSRTSGSVNAWLLRGDPLTLIDTGPRDDEALAALEAGLRRQGLRVEDIELRARDASPSRPRRPRRHHRSAARARPWRARPRGRLRPRATPSGSKRTGGSPARSCATTACPSRWSPTPRSFWDFIRAHAEALRRRRAPRRRRPRPGRRARPARRRAARATARRTRCSSTTRDALAFAGDHLLAAISSNTEICPRRRSRDGRARARVSSTWRACELTAAMPLARLLTGHGDAGHRARAAGQRAPARPSPPLRAHPGRPRRRSAHARSRSPAACGRARTVAEQPLLVVWEVVGHLELLLDAGAVAEQVTRGRRAPAASRRFAARRDRRRTAPRTVAVLHEPRHRAWAHRATRATASTSRAASRSSPAARAGSGSPSRGLSPRPAPTVIVASRKADACDEVAAELRAAGGRAPGTRAMSAAGTSSSGSWMRSTASSAVSTSSSTTPGSRRCTRRSRDVTEELFDKVIAVNLKGPFRLSALVGERMAAGERRLDHQRLEHRRGAPDRATSSRTPPRRPG